MASKEVPTITLDAIPANRETLRHISRLAPLGGLLVLLYLLLGVFCAYDALLEYEFNVGREPARVPYLMTIYASLEALLAMSAFRTGQATILFHRLRHLPTPATLDAALMRVRDMLLLFFVWTGFAIASYTWFRFHPAG